MRLSSRMKLEMITVPWKSRGENQGFVQAKDVDRLLEEATEILGRENRAKRKRPHRAGAY